MRTLLWISTLLLLSSIGCGVAVDFEEIEPNNTAGQAKEVGVFGAVGAGPSTEDPITISGAISPAGDVDFFAFRLTATSDIKLQTFDKSGVTCKNVDTKLELIDTNGNTSLVLNDDIDPGKNGCSLIDPTNPNHSNATRLSPGVYFAKVTSFDQNLTIGAYHLEISIVSFCGDANVQGSEECDDGNQLDTDSCRNNCSSDLCGNGVVNAGEQCDDNNNISGDGCDAGCLFEAVCGDGTVDSPEECDDNNVISGDGCDALCQAEVGCGNGVVEAGEQCDDGNTVAGDGCDDTCQDENCGNGVTEAGEQCDDGNNNNADGCDATCLNEPGNFGELEPNDLFDASVKDIGNQDVLIHAQINPELDVDFYLISLDRFSVVRFESFDTTGPGNCQDIDTELRLFALDPINGDFVPALNPFNHVQLGNDDAGILTCAGFFITLTPNLYLVEVNDFGSDETYPYDLAVDFEFEPVCGDGYVALDTDDPITPLEECDDRNTTNGDGCSSECQIQNGCGDGNKVAAEQCDDDNLLNDDGCSSVCSTELGFTCVNNPSVCAPTACGDGLAVGDEACDDGNVLNNDGCTSTCARETGHFFENEPNDSFNGFLKGAGGISSTAETLTLHGSINPTFDTDLLVFSIDQRIVDIKIETVDPLDPTCSNIDTVIQLFKLDASQGGSLLAFDDDDGAGTCSKISSADDVAARNLSPGDYAVKVVDFGQNTIIDNYQVKITLLAACGDAVVVPGLEECDNGNANSVAGPCLTDCTQF